MDQNINKDMLDSDLIDVDSLDYSDDQTWLYSVPEDSGQKVDIVDWNLSCDWPISEDVEYYKLEKLLFGLLDNIIKFEVIPLNKPDIHKFDSRTFVKPKKRPQRPSIQSIVEGPSNPPSMSPHPSLQQSPNKYLTYNKYSMPLGPISPMLRLKTFNVDANTDNSHTVKEYAMKRRSLVQDDDPQLEDIDMPLTDSPGRLAEHAPSKPINIDLSQPAHNLHNTFNKGLNSILNERGSLNMYQSGESLMRMSPPSLVSSLLMESSGTFNPESIESRKSLPSQRDSGFLTSGRDSRDPMMTSMTLSILDEKDMSTSFLSQTTYPDNDSLNSLPPSLVSSVNSSYVVSNSFKMRPDTTDSNIFSSATFTHLEQSEKLLSARPRCQPYNNITKRESMRNSESYTKSREEACQIVLNENSDKNSLKSISIPKINSEMGETITLHYANNKFRKDNDAEKENFERDDAFFKEMGIQKPEEPSERNSLNVTLGKQELNEIIQARQKLSLARKALPTEPDKLSNQREPSPVKTIQLPNQTITVPRQSMENASELLSKRRAMNANGLDHRQEEPTRELPKRSATFKMPSPAPKATAMDTTVVFLKGDDNQMIDINSATLNLIDGSEKTTQQEEWGSQERAMVGSSESTDTGTFSSSSPPDSVPDTTLGRDPRTHVASTPLMSLKKGAQDQLLNLHNTISPIYDMVGDKSYTLTKALSTNTSDLDHNDINNTTIINSATMVKRSSAKRDILSGKASPDKKMFGPGPGLPQRSSPTRVLPSAVSYGSMVPPQSIPRKTSLPTSKLRQYSSHRELSRIPGGNTGPPSRSGLAAPAAGRLMARRAVYASNPALSPTAPAPPIHTNSYTVAVHPQKDDRPRPVTVPPPLVRQGTETLRRERPQSQLVAPKDPPTTRPYSIAGASQLRVAKPAPGPVQKIAPAPAAVAVVEQPRASALPRPSRLPAPRRALRPPSVYSVAPQPAADMDHY